MRWVYLSPHFDDVVLSCGGLVWEQVQSGMDVEIWTVCAGAPDESIPISDFAHSLHTRWQTETEAVAARQKEDLTAGRRLGAELRYWDLPDCIYRQLPGGAWLVNGEEDLWKPVHPLEAPVVDRLVAWLKEGLRPGDALVSPLTLGNHVDHFLVREAAERLGGTLWYYADYPYAVSSQNMLASKMGEGWKKSSFQISRSALRVWQEAVASYVSQISTFWGGLEEMNVALETYWRSGGGSFLWKNSGITQ
jgi:LmbE family N-acetylglucosaminyl deacetylase